MTSSWGKRCYNSLLVTWLKSILGAVYLNQDGQFTSWFQVMAFYYNLHCTYSFRIFSFFLSADTQRKIWQQKKAVDNNSLPFQDNLSNCPVSADCPIRHHLHCLAGNQLTGKEEEKRRQFDNPYLLVNICNWQLRLKEKEY